MSEIQVAGAAVEIATAAGVVDAQLFHPAAAGNWPAVLLLTDIRGSRPAFDEMGRHLAAHGYTVLLPNLYYRGGHASTIGPALATNDDEAKTRRAALRAALTPSAWRGDLTGLLAFLDGHERVRGRQFGIAGYCMSGSFALRGAADFPDRITAAASFHGGGLATDAADSPHLRAGDIKARLYLGHADADGSMPPEAIARLDTALREANVDSTSETYTGAKHGFAVSDGQAYNAEAAARHWRSLFGLFAASFAA
jgi:carboxymethylenebutenolidase